MSDNFPTTIYNREKFEQKLPAGFDGAFDWSWTFGCFGDTNIEPMDFDGVVERRGNFLVFETKEPGKEIPKGQRITLETAFKTGAFTIFFVWGKQSPEQVEVWHPALGLNNPWFCQGTEMAREAVRRWFAYANKNPRGKVDLTILTRRALQLQQENERMSEQVRQAVDLLRAALHQPKT